MSRARKFADFVRFLNIDYINDEVSITGIASTDYVDTATADDLHSITADSASTTIDMSLSDNFKVNLQSNTTFTFSNLSAGQSGVLYLVQDATGGRTFTLPAVAKTPKNGASIAQVTTGSTTSVLSYTVLDSSNVLINYIGDFA